MSSEADVTIEDINNRKEEKILNMKFQKMIG
jgi:hypothetical protein